MHWLIQHGSQVPLDATDCLSGIYKIMLLLLPRMKQLFATMAISTLIQCQKLHARAFPACVYWSAHIVKYNDTVITFAVYLTCAFSHMVLECLQTGHLINKAVYNWALLSLLLTVLPEAACSLLLCQMCRTELEYGMACAVLYKCGRA